MIIERDADDVARCFALERELLEHGFREPFTGEITGLISAGAFVVFGGAAESNGKEGAQPPFEGMLPVRLLHTDTGREWWELNEQGTILYGERTGATLRLGDAVEVRVARVDSVRGRVDLEPVL
jgi:exoribonuclease R